MDAAPIVVANVNHHFGAGELRKQILFDVSAEIRAGEIVIVTGPSGSGKTTLLALMGALRSVQAGSVRVLGRELLGASEADRTEVRRRVGYVFQAHNLLDSLSARENVLMSLQLHPEISARDADRRVVEMLEAVGLGDRVEHTPAALSGGQRQRVAIARALVGEPRIVLADEPTASLDKQSGRDVVEILRRLAKEKGATVLLVTHDARILDVADRILHLEDGRICSFTSAVAGSTERMLDLLAEQNRKGELLRAVAAMNTAQFGAALEQVTAESRQLLEVIQRGQSGALESMLDQVLEVFTHKVGEILNADRATLFLLDEERGELWSKYARAEADRPLEIRVALGQGIAGHVAATGKSVNVADAASDPRFERAVDERTGYRTRSVLCVPLVGSDGRLLAVAQLLNRRDGCPFDTEDEKRFAAFTASLGVVLEHWSVMHRAARTARG